MLLPWGSTEHPCYKGLERTKNRVLREQYGDYSAKTTLDSDNLGDVQWWADTILTSQAPISHPDPECTVTSDASNTGWGAWMGDTSTGGHWSSQEKSHHINWLELKGAFLALQTFCNQKTDCHIRLMLDNTTAIACITKYGSSSPDLMQLTKQIFHWAIDRNLHLSASHIPGSANVKADKESRTLNLDTEWQLEPSIFTKICDKFGTPDIDLFASRLNAQLPRYVAWRPDPEAEFVDAFSMPWKNFHAYAFPPFSIISQVLQKAEKESSHLILVAPDWPTKPWYPRLTTLASDSISLPRRCLRMPQDQGLCHRLEAKLRLRAFRLF